MMNKVKFRALKLLLSLKKLSPKQMAKYAKNNTEFYKNYYKLHNTEDFMSLPIMSKYDLHGVSPYSLLSKKYLKKAFWYAETSGSSGSPTPSFLTKKDFDSLITASKITPYASIFKEVLKKNRTVVNGLTFGYTIAGFSFGMLMQKHGGLVAQLGTRSTIALPERTAGVISKLKPSIICGTPLDFLSWMESIRITTPGEYEKVKESLKCLISTAEPCAKSRGKQLEKYFGIRHINTYASVDGFVSIPCPCGEMHLVDGINYVELFDEKYSYIGTEGKGRLCFTSQIKKTTPLVRYMLDDLVTIKKSNCSYGFTKSILPHGRYELSMDINNQLMGTLDFEEIIFKHGLFMDYHLEINDDIAFLDLEEYPIAAQDYDISSLKYELEEVLGMSCDIELQPLGVRTDIKKVREAKSILRVTDRRSSGARQIIPQIL